MKSATIVDFAIPKLFKLMKSAALRSKIATVTQLTLKEHLVFNMTMIRLIKYITNMACGSSCLFWWSTDTSI